MANMQMHHMWLRTMNAILGMGSLYLCCVVILVYESKAQTIEQVLSDWDSIAIKGTLQVDTDEIAVDELRFLIVQEMAIIDTSRRYRLLHKAVAREMAGSLFVIRISERRDKLPVVGSYMKNDTLIKIYGKPEPGHIKWIVGKADGTAWLFYNDKRKVRKVHILCKESLLDGLSSNDAGGYYPVGSFPNSDLISIWTPTVKRHLFIRHLRGIFYFDRYYMGEKIESGLQRIAHALTFHDCAISSSEESKE